MDSHDRIQEMDGERKMLTLQETNIPPLEKENNLPNHLGRGYASFQEGIPNTGAGVFYHVFTSHVGRPGPWSVAKVWISREFLS